MLRLAFLSLWRRPLRYGLLVLLTAVACALPVFVVQMAGGLYQGLNRAAAPFPILAGAKGSPYQLVLNTVFLRDRPIGNIPAILVPLEDIWEAHAGHGAALVSGQKGEVTAILVRPKGYGQAMALLAAWQRKKGGPSQLLFPAQSLIALYGMVGQSRKFWITLSLGLLGAATLVTLLALYWDGTSRMEEWALGGLVPLWLLRKKDIAPYL